MNWESWKDVCFKDYEAALKRAAPLGNESKTRITIQPYVDSKAENFYLEPGTVTNKVSFWEKQCKSLPEVNKNIPPKSSPKKKILKKKRKKFLFPTGSSSSDYEHACGIETTKRKMCRRELFKFKKMTQNATENTKKNTMNYVININLTQKTSEESDYIRNNSIIYAQNLDMSPNATAENDHINMTPKKTAESDLIHNISIIYPHTRNTSPKITAENDYIHNKSMIQAQNLNMTQKETPENDHVHNITIIYPQNRNTATKITAENEYNNFHAHNLNMTYNKPVKRNFFPRDGINYDQYMNTRENTTAEDDRILINTINNDINLNKTVSKDIVNKPVKRILFPKDEINYDNVNTSQNTTAEDDRILINTINKDHNLNKTVSRDVVKDEEKNQKAKRISKSLVKPVNVTYLVDENSEPWEDSTRELEPRDPPTHNLLFRIRRIALKYGREILVAYVLMEIIVFIIRCSL